VIGHNSFRHPTKTSSRRTRVFSGIAITLFFCATSLATQHGLVAHWEFDDGTGNVASDSAGTNHGKLHGFPQWTTGQVAGALSFDGLTDYVEVPYTSSFQLPVLTLSVWVNPGMDLSTAGARRIAGRGEDDVTDHAAFGIAVRSIDKWGVGVNVNYEDNSDGDHFFSTGFFPKPSEWTHLAATRASDGMLLIYANGTPIGQWGSTPVPASQCYEDFTIGANKTNQGVGNFFPGKIDDVRLYDRALSPREIRNLYRNGTGNPLAIPTLGTTGLLLLGFLIVLFTLVSFRRDRPEPQ
jgi:hypothetical protein